MYYLQDSSFGPVIMRLGADGSKIYIPDDPDNADYQAYIAWSQAGNTAQAMEQLGSLMNADGIRRSSVNNMGGESSQSIMYVENDIAADRRAARAMVEQQARVATISQVSFSVSRRIRR